MYNPCLYIPLCSTDCEHRLHLIALESVSAQDRAAEGLPEVQDRPAKACALCEVPTTRARLVRSRTPRTLPTICTWRW